MELVALREESQALTLHSLGTHVARAEDEGPARGSASAHPAPAAGRWASEKERGRAVVTRTKKQAAGQAQTVQDLGPSARGLPLVERLEPDPQEHRRERRLDAVEAAGEPADVEQVGSVYG